MAKIRGFSILEKTDYIGLRNYLDFWGGLVDMKVTPFMEARQWLERIAEKGKLPKEFSLEALGRESELELALKDRGYIVHWEFDAKKMELVLNKWVEYKKEFAGKSGYPQNADGIE